MAATAADCDAAVAAAPGCGGGAGVRASGKAAPCSSCSMGVSCCDPPPDRRQAPHARPQSRSLRGR
eukprot:3950801-Alexandrium_andersonii.AAC.1